MVRISGVPGSRCFGFLFYGFLFYGFPFYGFRVRVSRQKQVNAPSRMKSEPVVKVEVSPAR